MHLNVVNLLSSPFINKLEVFEIKYSYQQYITKQSSMVYPKNNRIDKIRINGVSEVIYEANFRTLPSNTRKAFNVLMFDKG